MHWLKSQTKGLVGIDIDSRYIKLVELAHTNQQPKVLRFAIAELPMMVLTESDEIKEPATISSTLIQLKNTIRTTSNAAIALPGARVVTKQIILDAGLTDAELEAQVWLEAGKHFPDLIEDLSVDFYVNGPANSEQNKLDILLVACRKTSIEKRLEILSKSGFQVEIVDVDYYALERSLNYILQQQPELDPSQAYALLNFNSRSSTLVIVQNKQLIYAHDQIFESQRLLQKLQENLHWANIILHPAEITSDLDTAATALVEEILISHIRYVLELFHLRAPFAPTSSSFKYLERFYSSTKNNTIQKLFLAGDCAVIPKIAELVTAKTGVNTVIANPMIQMSTDTNLDIKLLQASAPLLTLCCGLSLHEGDS